VQEEVENKSVRLAIQTGKVTLRTLLRGLRAWYRHHERKKDVARMAGDTVKGKQSVKELIGQGQGVSSMEVGDSGIKDFKKIANKYGVDFAIVKDKDTDPPKYTVFFKARDADAITQVLKEYTAKQTKRKERAAKERPSILKKLKAFKEKVAAMPRKHKEKRKEQER
jgi:hypothetical protein